MEFFPVFRRYRRLGYLEYHCPYNSCLLTAQVLSFGILFASGVMTAIQPDNSLTAGHVIFTLSLISFHGSHSEAFLTLGLFLPALYILTVALFIVNPGNVLGQRGVSLLPPAISLMAVATTYSFYVSKRRALFLAHVREQVRFAGGGGPPSTGRETEATSCSSISLSSLPRPGYIREMCACFSWRDEDFEGIGYLVEEDQPDVLQDTLDGLPGSLS